MSIPTESLNPLELFLLVCTKSGILTTYDLLTRLGVGVGASSPALKRLEKQGLLTSTPGPRNRVQFVITEEGDKQLKAVLDQGPKQYWRQRRGTFESLHRAVFLAWVTSRPEDAKSCIAEAGEILRRLAEREELDAADFRRDALRLKEQMLNNEPVDDSLLVATVYGWIGAEVKAAELKLQAESLPLLDMLVADLPPAPKIWPEISRAQQTLLEP